MTGNQLKIEFPCEAHGTSLATLSSIQVVLGKQQARPAGDLQLYLRNKAGSVERILPFPSSATRDGDTITFDLLGNGTSSSGEASVSTGKLPLGVSLRMLPPVA